MLPRLVMISAAILVTGCSIRPRIAAPERLPRTSTTTASATKDPGMEAAIARARSTLDGFLERLAHPRKGEVFSVQATFPTADGGRQPLWLGDVTYKDGVFTGTVDTRPTKATNVRYGQKAEAKRADVTDWMILRSGNSEGGFTVQVMLRRQGEP